MSDSVPGPTSPYYWPEAPLDAVWQTGHWYTWPNPGWHVADVPPAPFPFGDGPWPRAKFGPPGTGYIFSYADLIAAQVDANETVLKFALNQAIKKLGIQFAGNELLIWETPDPALQPKEVPTMRWIHATIIGDIGSDEQVANTLNFRTSPAVDADQSPADMLAFGAQILAAWHDWWYTSLGARPVNAFFANTLQWKEIRTAYLEQTAPATVTTHVSAKTGHLVKDFHYPRPTYLVPTQYTPMTPAMQGTSDTPLPYEVAAAISLESGVRGPRYRGRIFLGPLGQSIMGGAGNFSPDVMGLASTFADKVVHALNTGSGNRLHIVSKTYCDSVGVNGVTAGTVPDSQRRRRRSRPELYPAAVAT